MIPTTLDALQATVVAWCGAVTGRETIVEDDLQQASKALFVVSTFGDGEAPDSARGFERKKIGRAHV